MEKTGLYFSCKIGNLPSEAFDVAEFLLDEGLSQLFTLTLKGVSKRDDFDPDAQLLQSIPVIGKTLGAMNMLNSKGVLNNEYSIGMIDEKVR